MTHEKNEEQKRANRLIDEKSPYLLQHAYNPVNWYPWDEEAFEKAKKEHKPIFLSIGYSTCHWCHVMERESFEDEDVAKVLNDGFVSIKVDREERPDIDTLYMSVCQAMTGQGGWPLTIIMTPDKKPFFAGTYFPKEDKWGRPGLISVLNQALEKWENEHDKIQRISDKITTILEPRLSASSRGELDKSSLNQAYERYLQTFDATYGGFGQAPKFPTPHNLMFLLRHWKLTGEEKALAMVEKTLDAMYRGGIYDHIGYGFARYSTDEKWLVPHFEKMLYDNALLAITYIEAYQATGKTFYARVAEEIFTYILRDMTDPEGAFYSAEDADSEGVEGKFYVWTPDEVKRILGETDGELFCDYYNISPGGNFEGKNIPNLIQQDLDTFHKKAGINREEWENKLSILRQKIFEQREKRVHPHKDDKILTSWNGLMIAALARGGKVLDRPEWIDAAARAKDFILEHLIREDGRLLARYRDGEAAFPGYIDDYAFFIWGLIELYEAGYQIRDLQNAAELQRRMIDIFWDSENGGFFFYGRDSEQLFARPKEIYDGATPSGNSVAALNLLKMSRLTGDSDFEKTAEEQMKAFAGDIQEHPPAHSYFLMALQFALYPTREIVIAGERNHQDTRDMIRAIHKMFLPQAVTLLNPAGETTDLTELVPFVKDQTQRDGKATAYVCENFACQSPVTELERLKKQLT
ncbi:MAG: thioredoxin domain-containing protein [Bacillaceae bacterium]|nr:thioredoxin domain-containing protein [Bacillaceae bacterium]